MRDARQQEWLAPGPGLRTLRAMVDSLLDGAPPELAVDLRRELPDPLKSATKPYDAEAPATLDELLERFRRRAELPAEDLLHTAQVAVEMVAQMLLPETMDDLRASFPPGFERLFQRSLRTR